MDAEVELGGVLLGDDGGPAREVALPQSARWTMRWKPVINAFAITSGDRWPAAEHY